MTTTVDHLAVAAPAEASPRKRFRAMRRFARNRPALIGAAFLVVLVLVAIFAPLVAAHDPNHQDLLFRLQKPGTKGHLLGTDEFGRDQLSRLIFGTRASLLFSVLACLVSIVVGAPPGLAAGFLAGKTDAVLGRVNDLLLAVPGLLIAIVVIGVLHGGLITAAIVFGAVSAPTFYRLVRAVTADVRGETYIEASRALGATTTRTILRDVIPNVLGPLVIQIALNLGVLVVAEATLSFLGLGLKPPTASWGGMLQSGTSNMTLAPFLVYPPGFMITLTVLAYLFVGDGLRRAFGTTRSAVAE
ncbi:MAG: ABC transporter permease, partial [Acidobacteria bacterium]|nr:ABC transporter permease [Acidobacteriota bacterium]